MENHENLSDLEIRNILERKVRDIRTQIEKLQTQLKKTELALGAYVDDFVPFIKFPTGVTVINTPISEGDTLQMANISKLTTAGRMEYILSKYKLPLTSSEFLKAYNESFPEKKVSQESWSSQLSVIYRDEKRNFKRIEFPENPQETRFFYALKQWFVNDELKTDILNRLGQKHKLIVNNVLFK